MLCYNCFIFIIPLLTKKFLLACLHPYTTYCYSTKFNQQGMHNERNRNKKKL